MRDVNLLLLLFILLYFFCIWKAKIIEDCCICVGHANRVTVIFFSQNSEDAPCIW